MQDINIAFCLGSAYRFYLILFRICNEGRTEIIPSFICLTCLLFIFVIFFVCSILVTGKTLSENAELVPSLKEGQVELTICLFT